MILREAKYKWFVLGLLFMTCFTLVKPAAAEFYPETYDVIIDVGHGGVDGGTSANQVLEKDINLAIGKKLYKHLEDQSFAVGITRIHDYALSDDSPFQHIRSRHIRDLAQRKLIADSLKPKVYVSLHVNWSKDRSTRGPIVIYQASEKSYALAHLTQHHLNSFYGVRKWPVKGKHYYLMKNLGMPTIIVETGYISNSKDLQILMQDSKQDEIASSIAHAISEYFLLYPF